MCFIKYPVLVVIRARYNSKSSCYRRSRLFEYINFPAGVHHITQHAGSNLAGHTFLGHARPRKINTSQPHLGSTERSTRRSKSYARRGLGPSPIAHLHVAYAAGSRPSNLHYKGSCVNAVQSGARRSVADITKASADTTTSSARNYSRVVDQIPRSH